MVEQAKDYYRFVECPQAECRLRFPGVDDVPCPRCKTPTRRVADRCEPATASACAPARPLALLLDNVRSLFNVGSMFRSADGAGIERLYLGGITPTPEHSGMQKTALGAQLRIAYEHHRNGVALAEALVAAGKTLWALEFCQGSRDLFALAPSRPERDFVLVLGNEVTGVDPGILALCQHCVHIPMRGEKASLNVATAMGIAAYALS